jgi:LysR family glycine cleavage system transcriptional activator
MASLNQLHLNGLRAVEAVLRGGSLQKAAEELGVSASAVSQHVARTEAQLGRALFDRTPSGLAATPFGVAFGRRLTAGFDELAAAAAMAEMDKTLVISVAPVFASRWLMPRLMRHFDRYPDVMLRIDASPKLVDLDHSDVSAAIRLGKGDWPGVEAERLFEVREFPVCAPYMASRLKTIADLAQAWVITDDNSMLGWDAWFSAAGHAPVTMSPGAHFSDPTLCLESAIAGHGVMLAWDMLAGEALKDGRLVAPFGVTAASSLSYYVVTSSRRRPDIKTRNFMAWLREEVRAVTAVPATGPARRP